MKIVVCSKNKAKNDAVKIVLKDYFKNFELISLETDSGVSATPVDDEEGILGCHNRIKDALSQIDDGNIYVAMEGILNKTKFGWFLCGWTTIYDKVKDKFFYGCSAKVQVPSYILDNLKENQRLSELVAKMTGKTDNEIGVLGTNGLLSNGVYTRTDEFVDSVKCAISVGYKKI